MIKQHYDVRWETDCTGVNLMRDDRIAARVIEVILIQERFYTATGVDTDNGFKLVSDRCKTLAAAKRAAITRLMASTEEL